MQICGYSIIDSSDSSHVVLWNQSRLNSTSAYERTVLYVCFQWTKAYEYIPMMASHSVYVISSTQAPSCVQSYCRLMQTPDCSSLHLSTLPKPSCRVELFFTDLLHKPKHLILVITNYNSIRYCGLNCSLIKSLLYVAPLYLIFTYFESTKVCIHTYLYFSLNHRFTDRSFLRHLSTSDFLFNS